MNKKILLLSLIIFSYSMIVSSQSIEKNTTPTVYRNQIGIQFNPYLNSNEIFDSFVYGLRYGYRIIKPVTLGAEIAGYFPAFNYPYPSSNFKAGGFARYTLLAERRFQPFLDVAAFYSHTYIRGTESYPGDVVANQFGLNLAPGISLYTKNRKFSLDLYYKFYIHPNNFYHKENAISYKFNFHF